MKKHIQNTLFSLRPKYMRESPLPPCHVIDKIQEELSEQKNVEGHTFGNDAVVKLNKEQKGFWSPRMDIKVRKRGKGSYIYALMLPDSKMWALYVFLMALSVILFFLGLLMLVYKWVFQLDSPFGWSIPVGLFVAFSAHAIGKFVQLKAKSHMKQLWTFFDGAINAREKKQRDLLNELFPDEELMI